MNKEVSCGIIVFDNDKVLLIKHKGGHTSFPKGHVEADESEEETALRETLEETSFNVQINRDFRYEISYQMDNGNTKTVIYFLSFIK